MKKIFTPLKLLATSISILMAASANAQQVFDIDSSFGQDGRKILKTATGNTLLYDVQKQSDGKIIAAGQISNQTADLLFFRRNADGTADNSFGNNGVLSWDISGDEGVSSTALQTDGKIVACGWQTTNNITKFLLTRMDGNGIADNSFGAQGVVSFSAINGSSVANSAFRNVKIQQDGKIVVVGRTFIASEYRGVVQRYKTDGTLDSSFGTNGNVFIKFVNGSHNYAEDVFIQNDGMIVVLGSSSFTAYKIHLTRLDVNGGIDPAFGTSGNVSPVFSGFTSTQPSWVTVLPDGRIQVLGYAYNGTQQKVLCFRTSSTGQMDNNFGTGGVASFAANTNNNYAWDAHLNADKELFIATEYYTSATAAVAAIMKVDSNGVLMSSYGTNGIASFATLDGGFASALTDDGNNLLLAGGMKSNTAFNYEGFVLKGDASGTAVSAFGLPSSAAGVSGTLGTKMFRLRSGNILVVGTNENNDKDIMLTKMDASGNLISSFGINGTVQLNTSPNETVKDAFYLQNGRIVFLSETGTQSLTFPSLGSFTSNKNYTITVVDTNGSVTSGPHHATFDATEFPRGVNIAVDGNGKFVVLGRSHEPVNYTYYLARHQSGLAPDGAYGTNGKINLASGNNGNPVIFSSLTTAPDNNVLFVIGPNIPSVWKLKDDASGDITFATQGAYGLRDTVGGGVTAMHLVKGINGYYIHYSKNGTVKIIALDFNGNDNATFGTAVLGQYNDVRIFEMPDTSLMVGLRTDSVYTIQHILKNGTVDNSFNGTGSIVVKPFTEEHNFIDWAVTSDTGIYLYHQFKKGFDLTYIGVSKISTQQQTTPQPNAIPHIENDIIVTVYPNPIQNKFQIAFKEASANPVQFSYQLSDIAGRQYPVTAKQISSRVVAVESYSSLAPGTYFLNASNMKDKHFTIKLVKE